MFEVSYQWPFPAMTDRDAAEFCRDCPEHLIDWLPRDVLRDYIIEYQDEFRAFMRARAERDVEVDEAWLD